MSSSLKSEREERRENSRLNGIGRAQDDRVGDESVLVLLDLPNHGGLDLRSVVVVNHSETSEELKEGGRKGEKGRGRRKASSNSTHTDRDGHSVKEKRTSQSVVGRGRRI